VYRPCAFVRARRVTFVSSDVTSTVASLIGRPLSAFTVPVMMSVVAPICATALDGMATTANENSAAPSRAAIARNFLPFKCFQVGVATDAAFDVRVRTWLRPGSRNTPLRARTVNCHVVRPVCQRGHLPPSGLAILANIPRHGQCLLPADN